MSSAPSALDMAMAKFRESATPSSSLSLHPSWPSQIIVRKYALLRELRS